MAEVREKPAEQTSIRINSSDRLMLSKLAGLRDVGIADLLASRDVQTFFRHLLVAELAKETKALAGAKS
jgi:CelD/BcsL family acetyltransferase involved in cellulose biosynthesis